MWYMQGRIQDFKLGGADLKKLRRAEGGAKIVGVFRVKNHDFTPKNHIFSNFREARAGCAPPWIRPCFRPSSFGHYVVCPSNYGFWLPPFGIFKLLNNPRVKPYLYYLGTGNFNNKYIPLAMSTCQTHTLKINE